MRRVLHTLYEYLAMWFGLGVLGLLCLLWSPFSWVLYRLQPQSAGGRLGRYMNMRWFRFYLWTLAASGACRFDIRGLDALRDQPPVIIAPNHPSLLDAVMVISRLPNIVCIMKTELMNNLFLRSGARLARYIGNASMLDMIRSAADALRQGNHLLLFPEGTRTVREPVNEFTNAVGLIARRAGVPVQTVFIESDSRYLGKGWPLFKRPSMPINYRIRLGKRFDPPQDVRAFTVEMEQYFAGELAAATLAHEVSPKPARQQQSTAPNLANRT
ncbi:MAG: 1-acyl-sn-glycerol-3-phosphate acyltransferase [Betaproteobacteria bacterium]|nr:1-acyl-sn-glycerol-3-phosphate acyltransferase [Betaproteobacteria bacterium]